METYLQSEQYEQSILHEVFVVVQQTLTHGVPQEFLPIQYSTPFSSTPHPATEIMWLIYHNIYLQ